MYFEEYCVIGLCKDYEKKQISKCESLNVGELKKILENYDDLDKVIIDIGTCWCVLNKYSVNKIVYSNSYKYESLIY